MGQREKLFRKINKIYFESFHSDILISDLIKKRENDLSGPCQQYDSVLGSILDNALYSEQVNTKTLPPKPPTPLMTPEIMKAETLRHNHMWQNVPEFKSQLIKEWDWLILSGIPKARL